MKYAYALTTAALVLAACSPEKPSGEKAISEPDRPTAKAFIEQFDETMGPIQQEAAVAQWIRATYITPDTAVIAAKSSERFQAFLSESVNEAKSYIGSPMDETTGRAMNLLLLSTAMPAPSAPDLRSELSRIATDMEGMYGAGKYCSTPDNCQSLEELEKVLASSRDYDEQLQAWLGWREVSVPMKPMYQRFVELTNMGAKEFGYQDLAEMWKSGYDMSVDEFEAETERLWTQVRPLYEQLHCYVRSELSDFYGAEKVADNGPIPAHLLGNMWSQTWGNIYDLVAPYPNEQGLDVTKALVEQKYDAVKMTETAEDFFVSLGLPELPDSFWQNSMLTKPRDRDVVCHASAWDLDGGKDPRIKQCVEPTEEQLSTLHHELGHIYYFLMYVDQPLLFRTGAHDGFHEAIGDTIVLSMTPSYLKKKGLIDAVGAGEKAKINEQMKMALEKIAFLPFGKLIDQWRWRVFSGQTTPDNYNRDWWQLREAYQGIAPPEQRGENYFDPGAKYHIPGNTPYTRYFLSFIIQFQFHKALCEAAGFQGPLSECSIYGNKAAGERLGKVLAMGASRPWPEAMEVLTGSPKMDGAALLEYFEPLRTWLTEQNTGRQCGWSK